MGTTESMSTMSVRVFENWADHESALEGCTTSGTIQEIGRDSSPQHRAVLVAPTGQPSGLFCAFGPFRLFPRQRLLLEGDEPLRLGSRALDILIALLERPGELVTKQELIARVWPGIIVDDGNLKVHVAALRRTLRDGRRGNRYICTVPGRGYCFVAPVIRREDPLSNATRGSTHKLRSLPELRSVSGRDLIGMLATQLSQQRFMTVVGAGDVAKSMFLAAALMAEYQNGVRFVDLALVNDPLMLPSALGAAIGLEVDGRDPLTGIVSFLRDKHMLLVLDNCRHLIGATDAFATSVIKAASHVLILAISR